MKINSYVKYSEKYFKEWLKFNKCSNICINFNSGCNLCEESERKRVLKYFGKNEDYTLILEFVIISKNGRITLGASHIHLYESDVYEIKLKDVVEDLRQLYNK